MKISVPRSGLSQVLSGQKGVGDSFFPLRVMISPTERRIRIKARPKGRKPGPGCLGFPMARYVELQAVISPIARRIYPVTRSHFSMGLLLTQARFCTETYDDSLKR
jgi:hypothetical protein